MRLRRPSRALRGAALRAVARVRLRARRALVVVLAPLEHVDAHRARAEPLARRAHRAAWQEAQAGNGPAVKPFDAWLDQLEDIEAVGDEDDESPLDGTP